MYTQEYKLDNPVWNSLSELDEPFSIAYDGLKFYNPEYCPFAAARQNSEGIIVIPEVPHYMDDFLVFGEKPKIRRGLSFSGYLSCYQMLLESPINIEIQDHIIELKSEKQKTDLTNLIKMMLPNLFKNKSSEMGKYFGIYKKEKLIAVLGERMKMNEFTEISSVVTHPQHTGKGYAKQLMKYITDMIFNENKTPYLHVVESNKGAIKLYQKLGFSVRKKLDCWIIRPHY